MKNKRLILLTLLFFFASFIPVVAQDLVIPVVKTPFPVKSATWNNDGSAFAITEQKTIIVRDANKYNIVQSIETTHDDLAFVLFAQQTGGSGLDQLATVSSNNVLSIRILPRTEPINIQRGKKNTKPTALAFNVNGNYIATGCEDGTITIYMQNYFTNTLIKRQFTGIEAAISSLAFSKDSKYLVTGSKNDEVTIWDVASGKLQYSFHYNSSIGAPVLLALDTDNIICAIQKRQIGIFDFEGFQTDTIKTKYNIKSICLSADGRKLIVLMDNNQFHFYDLETKKDTGYIPAYDVTAVSSYAFDNTGNRVLVCHEDGSVYILTVNDVMLDPKQRPPEHKVLVVDDTSMKNRIVDSKNMTAATGAGVPSLKGEFIPFDIGIFSSPSPYTVGIYFDSGYKNYTILSPFYVGGLGQMYMGFPQNDFPYTYYLDDTKLSSPLLMGTRLLGCAGFTIRPLPIDIDFFTEVLPGINLCWLWDGKAGRQSISTKVFASFYTAIVVGAGWRFVNVSVRGEYDALLGFSYTGNIGFNLDLEIIKGFFTGGIKK